MKRQSILVVLLAAILMAMTGLAVADSVGPAGTLPGQPNAGGLVKTPPLMNSDIFVVPMSYHSTFAFVNWAGVIIDINIDPNPEEAEFVGAVGRPEDGVIPGAAGFTPTFNGLMLPTGAPVVSFWSNNAFKSGTTPGTTPLGSSVNFPIGSITFHATNTDVQQNTGTDITFSAWNIYHVTEQQGSTIFTLPASLLVYLGPDQTPNNWGGGDLGGPQFEPPRPGEGQWFHLEDTFVGHVTGSWFWGTSQFISGVGAIGVEHVPETASTALLLCGVATLVVARTRRRK